MKPRYVVCVFAVWITLWAFFIVRELYIKGAFRTYAALLTLSTEEKRSYVTGKRFYEFLTFCKERLPHGASYAWDGIEHGSLRQRRAAYYLYPHLEKRPAEFILIFDTPRARSDRHPVFAQLDTERYILQKGND